MSKDFKVGDSVVAKPGTEDPDIGGDISGWQGRITEIQQCENAEARTILIEWDSITLRSMPESVIIHCERKGLDWTEMSLFEHEVMPATARDTEQDVIEARSEIHEQYVWIGMGDDEAQGRRIQAIVNSAHNDGVMTILEAWDSHLQINLTLPFKAEVYESQDRGSFRVGDEMKVLSLSELDEFYGLIVQARVKRRKIHFPLCDLEVSDKNSPNHPLVADYRFWFANR